MSTSCLLNDNDQTESVFLGLAPFLRMSIAGTDLLPIGQEIKAKLEHNPDDANQWMNLSTVMLCLGHRDIGLAIQAQALEITRVYRLAAAQQPAKVRLLMLMAAGDLATNAPLDCLLENSDIDLVYYFVSPATPWSCAVPEHDVVMVAVSESDENLGLLDSLEQALVNWPKPVINAARYIPATARSTAGMLLQSVPGLFYPVTSRVSHSGLKKVVKGKAHLSALSPDCELPIILRPVGSHGGRDLVKISCLAEIAAYLSRVDAKEFYLSRFIDYSGKDGLFRKFRIALIDGTAYACHLAVSSNWMIHYVNAGMYDDAEKRAEEAAFMANFDAFVKRHQAALQAIYDRTKLDYLCIDATETQDGQLFVFEIDHAMVVHAMDPVEQFPYKPFYMQKVQNAFRDYLFRLIAVSLQTP